MPNQEEEAHFYWTINEFEDLLSIYGIQFVLSRMNQNKVNEIKTWFREKNFSKTKEVCALCK